MKVVALAVLGFFLSGCKPVRNTRSSETRVGAFLVVYRWSLRPDCEVDFTHAWEAETRFFRSHWGSYGTELAREAEGRWVAMAYWPSQSRWEEAHRSPIPLPEAEATLAHCILEKEEEMHLEVKADMTAFPSK